MKSNQVRSIPHDLLNLMNWENPLTAVFVDKRIECDLLNGKISNHFGKDSLTNLFEVRRAWFKNRVKKLNGKLKDFDEAKIIIFGRKEKIKFSYKG